MAINGLIQKLSESLPSSAYPNRFPFYISTRAICRSHDLKKSAKTTTIRHVTLRDACVSQYHSSPIEGLPETPRTPQHYIIGGCKGASIDPHHAKRRSKAFEQLMKIFPFRAWKNSNLNSVRLDNLSIDSILSFDILPKIFPILDKLNFARWTFPKKI